MVSWIYANRVNGASQGLAQELKGLPGADPHILENLSAESDPALYWSDLLSLAREAESQRNYQLARGIYQNISQQGPSEDFKSEARARLAVLNGGGSAAERLEFLGREFLPQVTDPSLIAGMWVAGRCFRGIQQGLLPLFAPQTWAGHSAIWGTAFAGEVGGFVLAGRGVRSLQGHEVDWSASGLSHDLRHTGLGLLGLKAFGLGTLHFLGPMAKGSWFARALPTTAMAAGVMGSRALEMQMGWLPPQNAEQFLMDSAVTVLHFKALHGMLSGAPRSAENSSPGPERWVPRFQQWAQAPGDPAIRPQLVFSVESPSPSRSSTPPPSGAEPAVRVPKGSGVRLASSSPIYDSMMQNMDLMETEIHNLYNSPKQGEIWLSRSLAIQERLVVETGHTLEAIRNVDPHSPLLLTLQKVYQETTELRDSLRELQKYELHKRTSGFAPSSSEIREFLRHLYAFPNKMINFMNGTDSIDAVFHVLFNSRMALEHISEIEHLPKGPILPELWNQEMIDGAHRVSHQLFLLFTPKGEGPWETRAHQAASDFRNLLGRALGRLREINQHELYQRETQSMYEEMELIQEILNIRSGLKGAGTMGPLETVFLQRFYQAPTSFGDFFLDGDLRLLRSARTHTHQARKSLESLEN